jgi:flagellar basal body-associated protein FliL
MRPPIAMLRAVVLLLLLLVVVVVVVVVAVVVVLTAVELSLGGSSPYTSTDKTNENKYT